MLLVLSLAYKTALKFVVGFCCVFWLIIVAFLSVVGDAVCARCGAPFWCLCSWTGWVVGHLVRNTWSRQDRQMESPRRPIDITNTKATLWERQSWKENRKVVQICINWKFMYMLCHCVQFIVKIMTRHLLTIVCLFLFFIC